jgi:uncharacterized membrane protein YeaQ/YmgE (transglycosylase-associated protein family)
MRILRGFIGGIVAGILKIGISLVEWKIFERLYLGKTGENYHVVSQLWKIFSPEVYWGTNIWLIDIVIGILFGCLFGILHDSMPGKRIVKGIFYGFIIWIIGEFPGTVRNFMFIPEEMIIMWISSGLINSMLLGLSIAIVYELMFPEIQLKKHNNNHVI